MTPASSRASLTALTEGLSTSFGSTCSHHNDQKHHPDDDDDNIGDNDDDVIISMTTLPPGIIQPLPPREETNKT